jgi:hypothetical protein
MKSERRLFARATKLAVAVAVFALPVAGASAAPTTTVPSSTVPAAAGSGSGAAGTPATDSGNGIVESWAVAPAAADATSGNRPDLTYSAAPGATIKDAITVYNYGNVQETFNVYATDAFNNADGKFDILAGDKKAVDAGSWLRLDQGVLTVPPGKQVTVPISITIPADATPGDHVGAVVASSGTVGTSPDNKVITLDRRTGTRLYVRVTGKLNPDLHVANVVTDYHQSVNPLGGTANVTFRVENRGNVRLGGKVTVAISGPFGLLEKKVTLPELDEVLPGQKFDLKAELKDVPAMFLNSTTVKLVPSSKSAVGDLKSSSGDASNFAPPLLVLGVLLLAIIVVLVLRMRRRRTAPAVASTPAQEREHQLT